MKVFELDDSKQEKWNEFVRCNAQGTFFHLAEWKNILERCFGLRTYYLYTEKNGEICGVLPLALLKRPLFGPALVSTPLCVYGGVLGQSEKLMMAAAQKAQDLGVKYLELRQESVSEESWPVSDRFYTFKRALSESHEENLKAIPRKQRAEVRKAISYGLDTKINQDIDLFYKIYATSVRNLGTPVFPKKYLEALIEVFGSDCKVTTMFHQEKPLTSVLSFYYKDQVLPYYGGGVVEARAYSAYSCMYWRVMEHATENEITLFDFGRSMKDTGAFDFKKNFGFKPVGLPYQYHLVKATELPDMNPNNARNKILTGAWKRLPVSIANKLGPPLYPVIM